MGVQVQRRRFTVEEYHQMARAGVFTEDDRVELIEGEVVEMTPISSAHAGCVKRLNKLLSERVGEGAVVSVQDPIHIGEHSEPEPDVALLRWRGDYYASTHPGPQDVLLLVEVAETSVRYDRDTKIPLYAGAGILEVWLVDLDTGVIEVYRNPAAEGYETVRRVERGERFAPAAFPELELAAEDVLGPP